ncbi:MAG TPA: symmetrical bis(5'-nucleosyl)-tetraphosphatase [Acidiferrobacteraceae bacterium]|nr:symmetrical bis(5'-nucleosyl)-tetraphosphatase [Acidiferrobacteraceae bacterium]
MAVYAIGDVQGDYAALLTLLDRIDFDATRDRLWLTGDLVNRGPSSLQVLRFVRSLEDSAVTVLGNHDLHLLAIAHGVRPLKSRDTVSDVLDAPDRDVLLEWLRQQPLMVHDQEMGYAMVHAGLLPQWGIAAAMGLAAEIEALLKGPDYPTLLANMYGDSPDSWHPDLRGWARVRVIINTFTRLRFCDPDGRLFLQYNGPPDSQPEGLLPWFKLRHPQEGDATVVFGHWSALGLHCGDGVLGLDSGCIWGGHLTAYPLQNSGAQGRKQPIQIPCGRTQTTV